MLRRYQGRHRRRRTTPALLVPAFIVGVASGLGGFTSWHAAGVLTENIGSIASTEDADGVHRAGPDVDGDLPYRHAAISTGPVTLARDTPARRTDNGDATPDAPHTVIRRPVRVEVPTVQIDAQLVELGLDSDGALEVPSDFDTAGWWHGGAKPGETGSAVIAGHVDSYNGPAAFFSLGDVQPGDEIIVHGEDGTTLSFRVDRVAQHSKERFPTQRVYGPTDQPTLRLITCAGSFDHARREYSDNLIVYARAS